MQSESFATNIILDPWRKMSTIPVHVHVNCFPRELWHKRFQKKIKSLQHIRFFIGPAFAEHYLAPRWAEFLELSLESGSLTFQIE